MVVTRELLTALGVSPANANRYQDTLNAAMALHAIDTPLRIAHFLAQVVHESSCLGRVVENMSYSAERLLQVFPRHFASLAEAQAYAGQPERIGSRVYGGRMGNGDEASGDGYRYRGRGLIQLTGKDNYRAFSRWSGVDVLAHPDLVADQYAVQSAVYFWDANALNALADLDDIVNLTRRINGGLNGLDDRFRLLERAKAVLAGSVELAAVARPAEAAETTGQVFRPTHRVRATQLNLRSAPRVTPATWIASLAEGSQVCVLGDAERTGWVWVHVMLNGALREGVLATRYLVPLAQPVLAPEAVAVRPVVPPVIAASVPPVHLREDRADITRALDGGRAFPLGEPDRPKRDADDAEGRVRQILGIVDYLDSASPLHERYRPRGSTTYCNIYAYDFCYLGGVYLPRVWWTDSAIVRMSRGETVPTRYGETVRELNANALHDWLEDHGPAFGWRREVDLTTLQAAANAGEVCLIIGKRKDLNRSGHVSMVVPEHGDFIARRVASGDVIRPVESQAGTNNFKCAVNNAAWWLNARFQSCAFWRHP